MVHHETAEITETAPVAADEPDELTALRDARAATTDPADRATRSASAYLDARRRRLKRELSERG